MDFTQVLGWIGVTLSFSSTYPQIYKVLKNKSAENVSVHTYILIFIAVLCYIVRAVRIGATIFIVSNSLNACSLGVMLFLIFKYGKGSKHEATRKN